MGALKFTRNKDYSDDANNNLGGRDSIDPSGLDGEMDEIITTTDDHADKLDILLRSDLAMVDNLLQGHEFSSLALTVLASLIGTNTALVWMGDWAYSTDYAAGNLMAEAGIVYICLVPHTSVASGSFVPGTNWDVFMTPGAFGLPSMSGHADKSLLTNGSVAAWGYIAAANAPTLATLLNPTFTGVAALPDTNFSGRFNFSIDTVSFVAAGNAFDFDTEFMKKIDVSADYTGACSAANITVGDVMEIHMTNTKGSDAVLLWDSNWVWMGYAPSVLPSGKKAVLSLRAPTGSAATDIVAIWSVEP